MGEGAGHENDIQEPADKNNKGDVYRSMLSSNCSTHGEQSIILTEKPMEASQSDFMIMQG